ncbi:MAG TPA: hypothetical protein VGH28_11255 [Polyangiaceae bacterium]
MNTRSNLVILGSLLFAFGCGNNPGSGGNPDAGGGAFDGDVPDIGPHCDPSTCASKECGPDGTCAAGCKADSDCATGETCCNGAYCSDLHKDPQNCGACGTACGADQFCSGTACVQALAKNVCNNNEATVVQDALDVDDNGGAAVASAITSACGGAIQATTVSQGASGTMDSSGRPTTGPGNTYVAAGGGFGQKAIAYMNTARNAPVVTVDDSQNVSFVRASDGSTIVKAPITTLTATHDFFLIYAAAEPVSGTLVFAAYGLYPAGTTAAAFWLKNLSGGVATMDKQYYIYEWTGKTSTPASTDTWKLVESK